MSQSNPTPRKAMYAIMAAVLVWGCVLAVGVWLKTENWRGFAIVVTCTFAFVVVWRALLGRR